MLSEGEFFNCHLASFDDSSSTYHSLAILASQMSLGQVIVDRVTDHAADDVTADDVTQDFPSEDAQ